MLLMIYGVVKIISILVGVVVLNGLILSGLGTLLARD